MLHDSTLPPAVLPSSCHVSQTHNYKQNLTTLLSSLHNILKLHPPFERVHHSEWLTSSVTTGTRDRTNGHQLRLDWEPQPCEQLRETLLAVAPCLSKSYGCRHTSGHRTSHDFCLHYETGNDAAKGPNCRFDFIELQRKPPFAVIWSMFCPLPPHFHLFCSHRLAQLSHRPFIQHCLVVE